MTSARGTHGVATAVAQVLTVRARSVVAGAGRVVLVAGVVAAASACGSGGGGEAGIEGATTALPSMSADGTPTRDSLAGLPVVGPISARAGQVIEKVHVVSDNGPCVWIPDGVSDVIVRDVEIGPCGEAGDVQANGIEIGPGSSRITIERNVIHDVASGVYARGAMHPIVIDRNLIYNIRGPLPRGQAVQFNGVAAGSAASRITCNVSDTAGGDWSEVEDHISMYDSPGLPSARTVIAHNRLRGGSPTSNFGSGIMIGDGISGGHVWAHHNIVVNVANAGMGIAGGRNVTLEANQVFLDGQGARSRVGIVVRNYQSSECVDHQLVGNRVWAVDVIEGNGRANHVHVSESCSAVAQSDNVLGDTALAASIFVEVPDACR